MGGAQAAARIVSNSVSPESIRWACKRLEEFYAIHKDDGFTNLTEAMSVLTESVGLTSDEIGTWFCEWVNGFLGDGYDIPVTLGLLVGLMAADREKW